MCAVRINAVPVGFLQYAYASEVGGYEGYCTEVADNVFVDMTADVDKVYLDIIIAEYCASWHGNGRARVTIETEL